MTKTLSEPQDIRASHVSYEFGLSGLKKTVHTYLTL